MTALAPRDPQPPAVPAAVIPPALPPLPPLLANVLPSLGGDKLREDAAVMVGVAALIDWVQQCWPQKQCRVCNRWVEARAHDDHEAAHGPFDRMVARGAAWLRGGTTNGR